MCLCSAIYFNKGGNPAIDEALRQALYLLGIAGMIFGVLKSRNAHAPEDGYSFGKAFLTAYKIVAVAAVCLALFTVYIYRKHPDLLPLVADAMAEQIEQVFTDDAEIAAAYASVIRGTVSPAVLGFSEFMKVMLGALLPALITAVFFRRSKRTINK